MENQDLKRLGESATDYKFDKPAPEILEKFDNPFKAQNPDDISGQISITVPEFTSLCPITKQPDFATIKIEYIPDQYCVESKSLKLYMFSFRNHGEFHEACVKRICQDLVTLLRPEMIRVIGEFTPRGGIPFWPTAYWEKS
jgi:7-cyano-7-deazaguanine reductase